LEQIDMVYRESSIIGSVGYRKTILERAKSEKEAAAAAVVAASAYGAHPMPVEVLHFDDEKKDTASSL
jgi:hypothetical protein